MDISFREVMSLSLEMRTIAINATPPILTLALLSIWPGVALTPVGQGITFYIQVNHDDYGRKRSTYVGLDSQYPSILPGIDIAHRIRYIFHTVGLLAHRTRGKRTTRTFPQVNAGSKQLKQGGHSSLGT